MKENPPDMPQIDQVRFYFKILKIISWKKLKRLVCLNPRVTRMVINWDEKDENSMPNEATPEETSEPTPFNFELSNSQSMDRKWFFFENFFFIEIRKRYYPLSSFRIFSIGALL